MSAAPLPFATCCKFVWLAALPDALCSLPFSLWIAEHAP